MSKISLGERRRLRSKRKVGNGGRSGRIPQRGSQRRKPRWTEKEGTLGVGRRQCKSQRDQLNPTKALDSESPKLCLLIQLLSLVESAAPPSSRPAHLMPLRTYVQQGQPPVNGAEQGHLPVSRQPCHNQAGGQHQGSTVAEQVAWSPQQSQSALQQPGYHHCPRHLME